MKLIMKYRKKDIFLLKKDKKIIDELKLTQYNNGIPKNSKFDRRHIKSTI